MKKLFTLFILFILTGIGYGQTTNKKYALLSFNRNDYTISVYNTYHMPPDIYDYFWSNKITSKIIWPYTYGSNCDSIIQYSDINYNNQDEIRTNVWENVDKTNWVKVRYTNYANTNLTWTNYLIHFPKMKKYRLYIFTNILSDVDWHQGNIINTNSYYYNFIITSNFCFIYDLDYYFWNGYDTNYNGTRIHEYKTYDTILFFNQYNYTNKNAVIPYRLMFPEEKHTNMSFDLVVRYPIDFIYKLYHIQNRYSKNYQYTDIYEGSQTNIIVKHFIHNGYGNRLFFTLMEYNPNRGKYYYITNTVGYVYKLWDYRKFITSTNILTLTITNQ